MAPRRTRTASTPSTPSCVNGVLNIGTLELTSNDSEFTANTAFQDIAITDNLSANQNWTLSAQASNLHDGNYTGTETSANTINAQNVGLTALTQNVPAEGSNAYQFTTGGAVTRDGCSCSVGCRDVQQRGRVGSRRNGQDLAAVDTGPWFLRRGRPDHAGRADQRPRLVCSPGTITFTLATS